MRRSLGIAVGLTMTMLGPVWASSARSVESTSLAGSHGSMERQNQVARKNDFSFLRTSRDVRDMVDDGRLTPMFGNGDYQLSRVSHPAARPVLKTFVERLASQYHESCGEKLVITSLTRPLNEQPRNASDLSVHPTGMAVDLRVPTSSSCRQWLENTLLSMERSNLLDVTRERRPAHYHIAVFPDTYGLYAEAQITAEAEAAAEAAVAIESAAKAEATAVAAKPVVARTASISPGPGLLGSLLYGTVLLSGLMALMLIVRAEPVTNKRV
ncbi:MAG: DUF5715 family protein [Longimicrobiales bacterium]